MQKSTPTLGDVAKLAGVSTATVSRCLNMPEQVVEATRQKVQQAIDTLRYTPNFGARVMAAKRTFTIGAIIPTMENAIFARGLQAFQEGLHALGYTLLVSSSSYRPDVEEEQIRALVARGADGLLLIGYDREPAIYDYLTEQSVPVLISWAFADAAAQASIGFDNYQSMQTLARAVAAQGHNRVGVISAQTVGNDRARERLQAIRDVFSSNAAQLDVIETSYGVKAGASAFKELMKRPTNPTVVMCGNDVLAVGALRGARKMGLGVPDDLSITGFDDIELARVVTPTLTTVHVPHRKMGKRAAKVLVQMVETKLPGPSRKLRSTIKFRESLGAAK